MRSIFILAIIFFVGQTAVAQVVVDSVYNYKKLNRSLSFAQLTLGGDLLCLTGGQIKRNEISQSFDAGVMPRFTIGGMHFWGHADFYVSFPLGIQAQSKPGFTQKFKNIEGVETGLKIYPIALRPGRVSPYVGISFQPYQFGYQLLDESAPKGFAQRERFITPVQAGLTYTSKKYLFTAGVRYNWKSSFDYYERPTAQSKVSANAVNFSIGILRYIDTDKGLGTPKGVEQQNIMYHILKKENKLSAWYWGIGPSAALEMSKSSFIQRQYPFLNPDMLNSFLMPDLTFGHYFSKPDLNVGLSARTMWFKTGAFDTELKMHRSALALEAYKFLFDYHGFVPFVGPMFSMEYLKLKTNGITTASTVKPALGIVFGWDIRVTKTGSNLLRTNLRYTPGLYLDVEGESLKFNHLEFNFIQYVHFIGRSKVYKKYTK
jgi:hypothetical protein